MSISRIALCSLGALALTFAAPSSASAAGPSIGRLSVGGTGCPAGTASASLSGGGTVLSLKFTQYRASAGGGRNFDRKACGVAIPFTAPPGKSVAIVGVRFKGRAALPAGTRATISAETFFAGGKGPLISQTVSGPKSGAFTFTTAGSAKVWSACGGSFNLRVQSSIRVEGASGSPASITVRSQDVAAGLIYQLSFRDC
jgi:uncharacterized protein DUF4360